MIWIKFGKNTKRWFCIVSLVISPSDIVSEINVYKLFDRNLKGSILSFTFHGVFRWNVSI